MLQPSPLLVEKKSRKPRSKKELSLFKKLDNKGGPGSDVFISHYNIISNGIIPTENDDNKYTMSLYTDFVPLQYLAFSSVINDTNWKIRNNITTAIQKQFTKMYNRERKNDTFQSYFKNVLAANSNFVSSILDTDVSRRSNEYVLKNSESVIQNVLSEINKWFNFNELRNSAVSSRRSTYNDIFFRQEIINKYHRLWKSKLGMFFFSSNDGQIRQTIESTHVCGVVLPQNVFYQKMYYMINGTWDFSKVIVFIDREMYNKDTIHKRAKAYYKKNIEKTLLALPCDKWMVPASFIDDHCFINDSTSHLITESNFIKKRQQKQTVLENFNNFIKEEYTIYE